MVEELYATLPAFGGAASHTRCFLHVVNLIAKSLIHQFDVSRKDADAEPEQLAATNEGSEKENDSHADVETRSKVDNDDGWVDEVDLLTNEEQEQLAKENLPVKLALVKVCQAGLFYHVPE